MHRYRIIAQISLLSLVLASPIKVQGKQEVVVAEDVAAMSKNWRELQSAASDKFPRSLTEATASSPQDGSTSSGYPTPHLSSVSSESVSGYSWLLDRPPRLTLSPDLQAQLRGSTPHPSNLGPPEPPLPWPWLENLEPIVVNPGLLDAMEVPAFPHTSNSGSPEMPLGQGLTPPSSQHGTVGSDRPTTVTFSPTSNTFTLSHHPSSSSSSSASSDGYSGSTLYSSASGGSLTSHYFSASGGSDSESLPSHHLMVEGVPTEPPPDTAEFVNENMMKNLKIVVGVIIVGGTIASIVGSQMLKHRDFQDG